MSSSAAAPTAGDFERESFLHNDPSDHTGQACPEEKFWSFLSPEGGLISFSASADCLSCAINRAVLLLLD